MAKITVTIPPGMSSISGFLFNKSPDKLKTSPSYIGNIILGVDKNQFPIKLGKKPPKVVFEPYILISEDNRYPFVSEDSIFHDSVNISSIISTNGGAIFPVDSNGIPILNLTSDSSNWPDAISTPVIVNVNKNSKIIFYDINVPRRANFSYSFIDVSTKNINRNPSFYSIDFGNNWLPYSGKFRTSDTFGFGRVLIYKDITIESELIEDSSSVFLLNVQTEEELTYLTAEYGEYPDNSSKGTIIGEKIFENVNRLQSIKGAQSSPIPYGTFKRCLNNLGLTEFYGDSSISISSSGQLSYTYQVFQSVSSRCVK